MTYLADTSTIVRLRRGRVVAPQWLDAIRAGLVGICPVGEAELTRVDLLVAATAQAWGLTVLLVDGDFDTIAQVVRIGTRRADR